MILLFREEKQLNQERCDNESMLLFLIVALFCPPLRNSSQLFCGSEKPKISCLKLRGDSKKITYTFSMNSQINKHIIKCKDRVIISGVFRLVVYATTRFYFVTSSSKGQDKSA